ncbi:MAG: GNAT family N-acetyltransferase, partial [Actinomycetota bacterium]
MIEVMTARPDEWRRVRDLRLRALEDSPDAFGSTFERERGHQRRDWLRWISGWESAVNRLVVAIDGDEWIGMAVGSRTGDVDRAHLYAMWVDPRARRGGVGRRLVDAVLAWAGAEGATEIELGVTATNHAAVEFYEGLGFADTGERRALRDGSPLEVVVMR